MNYTIDPTTLRLVEREPGDDRPAACPVCGTDVEIEHVDATTRVGAASLPMRWSCPIGCNPRTGERGND